MLATNQSVTFIKRKAEKSDQMRRLWVSSVIAGLKDKMSAVRDAEKVPILDRYPGRIHDRMTTCDLYTSLSFFFFKIQQKQI